MALFNKDNAIKVFAILLVLAFIAEMFAIGANRDLPESTGQEQEQPTGPAPLFGVAFVNATVASYSDSMGSTISAEGNPALLENEAVKLKSEGFVSYTSKTQKGMVFNLPKGANITKVVERLAAINASMIAKADLTLKDGIVFYTKDGPVKMPNKNLRINLDPSIPVGYPIGLKITASLTQDRIIESVYEIVPIRKDILTVANVAKLYPDYSAIAVLEWPDRNQDKNATVSYLSQRFSNVGMVMIINNTVAFSKPVSLGTAGSIFLLNLTYLRNASTRSMLFYQNFTDNKALERDVGPVLASENITLGYPPSYARIDFVTENFSREFLNSSMKTAGMFVYRKATIQLGATVVDEEGRSYNVLSRNYTEMIPYVNETGVTKLVQIQASTLGNKLLNYTINEE